MATHGFKVSLTTKKLTKVNGERLAHVAEIVRVDMGHRIELTFVPQIAELIRLLAAG